MFSSYYKLGQEDPEMALHRFAKDVFTGLQRTQRQISSKYLYDRKGSAIYEEIMNLPEYYLVKAEYNSLENSKQELGKLMKTGMFNLIELGAGNGYKTKIILKHLMEMHVDFKYVPVDISEGAMMGLVDSLNEEFPDMVTEGLVGDYFDALETIQQRNDHRHNVVLFLGSTIGNFDFDGAVDFIFSLWRSLKFGDYIFMGFDLRKDIDMMIAAYNDPQGVTARFNLNLLERMNRELMSNFDISKWRHYEPYNIWTGAMESYLISLEDQEVYFERFKKTFHFNKWEPIFMEQSYKYTEGDIMEMASITGFKVEGIFYDDNKWFANALWCVKK